MIVTLYQVNFTCVCVCLYMHAACMYKYVCVGSKILELVIVSVLCSYKGNSKFVDPIAKISA